MSSGRAGATYFWNRRKIGKNDGLYHVCYLAGYFFDVKLKVLTTTPGSLRLPLKHLFLQLLQEIALLIQRVFRSKGPHCTYLCK